jgi:phage N-6-adenine-methyltransferase
MSAYMPVSKSETWETPDDLFGALDAEFGFVCDVAASANNAKCKKFFSAEDNGLMQEWVGSCWCNPPYGRQIKQWVVKAAESPYARTVMLLPARTDTTWFHAYIYNKPSVEVRFVKGRVRFKGATSCAPFPSMIVIVDNFARFTDVYKAGEL